MPGATMENEDPWKLPDDDLLPATLSAVKERELTYRTGDRKGEKFYKWEWEFQITDGQAAGLRAWGDTDAKLTNHPGNKVRQWAEALRGRPFDLGEGFHTDDLIGLPCYIQITHETYPRSDGSTGYKEPVVSVFPAEVGSIEPPF